MNEDASIRRANLALLCRHRGWSAKDLHRAMDAERSTYSYWRDLLADPSKSFGEKAARRIEEKLALGRGWLDEVHDAPGRRYPRATEPTGPDDVHVPLPFSAELVAALRKCPPALLRTLENTLRGILEMPMLPLPSKGKSKRA